MIDLDVCRQVEYEILGCHFEDLSTKDIAELLVEQLHPWRTSRGVTHNAYIDNVTMLFKRTKDWFDWAAVKVSDGSRKERPRPWPNPPEMDNLDFKGDPVDLRFMAFAEKVNKLILEQKSPVYKDSWRKRGFVGIYHNLGRKWDRIENICEDEKLSGGRELNVELLPTGDESIVETIADLFAYCGKTMAYFEYEPRYREMLNQWMKKHGLEDGS